jgi:hypothetical protein
MKKAGHSPAFFVSAAPGGGGHSPFKSSRVGDNYMIVREKNNFISCESAHSVYQCQWLSYLRGEKGIGPLATTTPSMTA